MGNLDNAPAGQDDSGQTSTAGTDVQPSGTQQQTKDWAAAYKGLQTSYNKLTTKLETLQQQYDAAVAQGEETVQSKAALERSTADLQKQIATLQQQMESAQAESNAAKSYVARSRLILAEFPELAQFEAKGLVPQAETEEAMREIFTKFRETLAGQVGDTVKDKLAGSSPAGSGRTDAGSPPPEETEDFVWDQVMKYAGVYGKEKEYQEWQAKLDAIQSKKK